LSTPPLSRSKAIWGSGIADSKETGLGDPCAQPGGFPGLIGDAAGDPALLESLRNTILLDGRQQIAQVLGRSVRRGELADTKAVPDLQADLIGAVLMLVLFEPEMDEGLLRNKIADLAMALSGGASGV
jgi:Tetracyclin repressor-like, C-terminal domain